MDIDSILSVVERSAGLRLMGSTAKPIAGGSINRAFRIDTHRRPVFLKVNQPGAQSMFEAEAAGLAALADAGGVRVPKVLAAGVTDTAAFLALEWIEFAAPTGDAERALGGGLATLHHATSSHFGWTRDNTIGATPQINTQSRSWTEFFGQRRLHYQLDLAERNGLPRAVLRSAQRLFGKLEDFIGEHAVEPSLVHGDLWGGNWGATREAEPVIFDPAIYYGDREVDIAMTRLFGGFGHAFYEAYQSEWPLLQGWERRVTVYNLYHLLNHFNLFGGGYLGSIRDALGELDFAC